MTLLYPSFPFSVTSHSSTHHPFTPTPSLPISSLTASSFPSYHFTSSQTYSLVLLSSSSMAPFTSYALFDLRIRTLLPLPYPPSSMFFFPHSAPLSTTSPTRCRAATAAPPSAMRRAEKGQRRAGPMWWHSLTAACRESPTTSAATQASWRT